MIKKVNDLTEELGVLYSTIENQEILKANLQLLKGATTDKDTWRALQLKNEHVKSREDYDKIIDNKMQAVENILGFKVSVDLPDKQNVAQLTERYKQDAYKNVLRLENTQPLYDAIFKQTQIGIDKGLNVVDKGGKTWSYKTYMEMKVRTTISTELSQRQLDAGEKNSIVFYICNELYDCAHDHADYQGRIYYDERWVNFGFDDDTTQKISEYISDNNLLSVQQVRDDEPYLTTRPNCRHTLSMLTLSEVLNLDRKEILDKLDLREDQYKKANYRATQELRYDERQIRKYKDIVNANKVLRDNAPVELQEKYTKAIKRAEMRVNNWQRKADKLCGKWAHLKRDYRREDSHVVLNDLGAKYTQKVKGGNNNGGNNNILANPANDIKREIDESLNITYEFKTDKLEKAFNGTGEQVVKAFNNKATHNDREVNELLANIDSISLKFENKKTGSRYNAVNSTIEMPKSETDLIIFHELGHALDNLVAKKNAGDKESYKWLSNDLKDAVNNAREKLTHETNKKNYYGNYIKEIEIPKKLVDVLSETSKELTEKAKKAVNIDANFVNKVKAKIRKEHSQEYIKVFGLKDAFDKEVKKEIAKTINKVKKQDENYNKWACLSDIYDAITKGMASNSEKLTGYHGMFYYMQRSMMQTNDTIGATKNLTEIFADYCEMRIGGYKEQLEMFEEISPDLKHKLDSVFTNMIKGLKK